MKKIVALVLSLVMVLGLATVAFAAPAAGAPAYTQLAGRYDFLSVDDVDGEADIVNKAVLVSDVKAPKDADKDGVIDVEGWVKHFTSELVYYVQVATVADADYIVYYTGTETLLGYFKVVDLNDVTYYGNGVAFTNFGKACGQYKDEPAEGVTYYTFENELYQAVKADANTTSLMVGGELVPVINVDAGKWVGHTVAYTYDKDYKVVGVKCGACGVVATIYANFASVPEDAVSLPLGDGRYYVWTNAVAAPEAGDKVESAETFDAGIAMYVGMSVMAAAGSAVVLKKKD